MRTVAFGCGFIAKPHRSFPEADIGNGTQHFGGADDRNADEMSFRCVWTNVRFWQQAFDYPAKAECRLARVEKGLSEIPKKWHLRAGFCDQSKIEIGRNNFFSFASAGQVCAEGVDNATQAAEPMAVFRAAVIGINHEHAIFVGA